MVASYLELTTILRYVSWPRTNCANATFVRAFCLLFMVILYVFSKIWLNGCTFLCIPGILVLIHQQQCINWHNFSAVPSKSMNFMASILFGLNWWHVYYVMLPHNLTILVWNLHFFADYIRFQLARVLKTSFDSFHSSFSDGMYF